MLSEKEQRWNMFINEICSKPVDELSEVQKNAVLCFWYDAELGSGGHSGYFDCYPDIPKEELYKALIAVSSKDIAENFRKAVTDGEKDDWEETDNTYYSFSPSLCDHLQKYVEEHKDKIFS